MQLLKLEELEAGTEYYFYMRKMERVTTHSTYLIDPEGNLVATNCGTICTIHSSYDRYVDASEYDASLETS